MAIKFFEGFDQHSGLDFGGGSYVPYDHGRYFAWSSLAWDYPLVADQDDGQAITVGEQLGAFGGAGLAVRGIDQYKVEGEARFGFWVQPTLTGTNALFEAGKKGLIDFRSIEIQALSNGTVNVWYKTADLTFDTLLGTAGSITGGWNYLEMYISLNDDTVTIHNTIDYTFSIPGSSTANSQIQWEFPGAGVFGSRPEMLIDDFWISDGESIRGSDGIKAVAVSCIWEGYEALNLNGLRGAMVVDGDRYETDWLSSSISSEWNNGASGGIDDKNVGHQTHYVFETNPATSSAWTQSDLDDSSWGVCFQAGFPGQPSEDLEVRVTSISLSKLIVDSGVVSIEVEEAGNATYFSGPWRRTDSNKTLPWHIRDIPRPAVVERADAKALYISTEGCLFFQSAADPNSEGYEAPLDTFGVTFAEEYRDDYRDWKKVDGIGLSFESYFVTGYGVFGEGDKKFQNNYVTVNYKNNPSGGAYIQGLWDYANDPDTGRWSMRQQIFVPKTGYTHLMRRLKIRGHGRAMQIRVLNEGDKPFEINGWSMMITGNAQV